VDELTGGDGRPPVAGVVEAAEVERLRAEVARLARDNAALRARVETLASGAVPAAAPASGVAAVSRARRWTGRLAALLLFVLGLALGAWYAQFVGSEFMRGYRDGRADATAPAAPATAPRPVP
jgi:anti-sigma factor RsiW